MRKLTICILLFAAFELVPATYAQNLPPAPPEIKLAIVDTLAKMVEQEYLFPDKAKAAAKLIREQLRKGAYDSLAWLPDFTSKVTEDLRSVTHDRHLGVWARPTEALQVYRLPDSVQTQQRLARQRYNNFGFEKIERLSCNIGYLKLNQFVPGEEAAEIAIGAMRVLANSDALIIDLRENGGGYPEMIQLISSYFFDERTHLNSFICPRDGKPEQFWTYAHVEGKRLSDTPLFILQSDYSFSAAEEFSYNLQALKRATIIGDTTGGGAHDNHTYGLPDLGVEISIPFTRAVNPITGTNWEGVGVIPDIACPDSLAMDFARLEAAKAILPSLTDKRQRRDCQWLIDGLNGTLHPVTLSQSELENFVGIYGPRKIEFRDGTLYYARDNGEPRKLTPIANRRFSVADVPFFRIEFAGDPGQPAVAILGMYDDGHVDRSDRTTE